MAGAALLSIALVPALIGLLIRGRIIAELRNPMNRLLIAIYRPVIAAVLRTRFATIAFALVVLGLSWIPLSRIGTEFMPTLNEGTIQFMPTTLPGLSITKAAELVQTQNKIIKRSEEHTSELQSQMRQSY